MRVLIAGGRGFLGTALRRALLAHGHTVRVLTRSGGSEDGAVLWDGRSGGEWTHILRQTDAVVNACGFGLEHWPWTPSRKREFLDSRVTPGIALSGAIADAKPRPRTFIQFSGINRYGLSGDTAADESTPAAPDFLAQLTVAWEDASQPVEELGVRRVIARNAIVLDRHDGLYPLMCLPARLFLGGRLGDGRHVVPWIHLGDHVRALLFLLEREDAVGPYNLVSPTPSSNAELMRAVCAAMKRPYWFHVPAGVLRFALGEMADLVLKGRASMPRRLQNEGFAFDFPDITSATRQLMAA